MTKEFTQITKWPGPDNVFIAKGSAEAQISLVYTLEVQYHKKPLLVQLTH